MRAFGAYISRYLFRFILLILLFLAVNALAFVWTFRSAVTRNYGDSSPQTLLEETAAAITDSGLSADAAERLRRIGVWAMELGGNGECLWALDVPEHLQRRYTLQEVAVFAKGYLSGYPVFIRCVEEGLLVLGYPMDSFMKITGNYLPIRMIRLFPPFVLGMLTVDLLALFVFYCISRRQILRHTGPIIDAVQSLADGVPVSLCLPDELSGIAESISRASRIIGWQNEARANWISGVSHDIRTPLSVIMGYSERIAADEAVDAVIREQANSIRNQSIRIRNLVQDLNLVSQLEYDMQPLHSQPVRVSKLLRTCAAEWMDSNECGRFSLEIDIAPEAEAVTLACDARLIARAVSNLLNNSVAHNPQGCAIVLRLDCFPQELRMIVQDDGCGVSAERLRSLQETPHYMESADERFDLRHGMGLLIVRQIMQAHGGRLTIESEPRRGFCAICSFPLQPCI